MKNKLRIITAVSALYLLPSVLLAQTPNLGTAANFALFSSNGAISNSGNSHITGNIGSNSGSSTAFGNVNGTMHDNDAASAACSTDLLLAYNQLNGMTPTLFPSALLGNGDTLKSGVYSISGAATLNSNLYLNAEGNPNATFIFQVQGAFSANASAKIKLINAALACNVFWKVEGLVNAASGVSMKGTVIANNAAINLNTGDTLEGRALAINGAVTVDGVLIYTPIGCGSPVLAGPVAPNLASTECYALFSSNGQVYNTGVSLVTGDVGTNNGLTTGFNVLNVTGNIHPIPDNSTNQCAADLLIVYNYLNSLPYDIELLYPAQFGNNLVLTPHSYLLNGATSFVDTLYLDAQNNSNAVFVLSLNGALTTSTYAKVLLINGAQAKNVYWKIEGAVDISSNSIFSGNIICNNGAISINTGVTLNGRAFTTTGSVTSTAITTNKTGTCQAVPTGILITTLPSKSDLAMIYPNPFNTQLTFETKVAPSQNDLQIVIYNNMGAQVLRSQMHSRITQLNTSELAAGIYYYRIMNGLQVLQSGKVAALK